MESCTLEKKAQRQRFTGIHNCCGPCCTAIRRAVQSVEGVTGDTAQPGKSNFEVIGDFRAADVIDALHAAGFHARIEG